MDSTLVQPLKLKCGLVLKNRLVKAAMAECMADNSGLPTVKHNNIYREWGNGGWGMILTGMSCGIATIFGSAPADTVA